MPSLFSKHLHLCFFKLKYPTFLSQPDPHHPPPPSTLNSATTFHFNTTYSSTTDDYFTSSSSSTSTADDTMDLPPPPDFATIYASQRFFISSPGSSNSIIESTPETRPCNNTLIPRGGVRVQKDSVNPYIDFLHSMQEMIRSHKVLDVNNDWDYLHQLLLCYLALNPPHTHKHIVRAFTHLVVDLLSSSSSTSSSSSQTPCRMHNHQRQGSFSGRLV